MTAERFKTELGEAWMDDTHGIVRFVYNAGAVVTLEQAKKIRVVEEQASGGKMLPILIDVRQSITVDQEARTYFAQIKTFSAFAFLIESPVSMMMTKMFTGVHEKELVPTRVFNSESEAIEWLRTFLN